MSLLTILYSVGEAIDRAFPNDKSNLSLVSEDDFESLTKKHHLECNYCSETSGKINAIAVLNGKYVASCSNECYEKLILELSE